MRDQTKVNPFPALILKLSLILDFGSSPWQFSEVKTNLLLRHCLLYLKPLTIKIQFQNIRQTDKETIHRFVY